MASSSSSDESCKAPENFRVPSSNDEVCDTIKRHDEHCHNTGAPNKAISNVLKCPLCCGLQNRFYCHICVKNGNFMHTTYLNDESLTEKQQKYLRLQADLKVFCNRFDDLIRARKSCENIQYDIKHKKEKITLLNQLINGKRLKLRELVKQRNDLRVANADKRKNLPKYSIKVKELEDYVLDRIEKICKLREKNHNILGKVKEVTRRDILKLVEYIFPISEVVLKDEIRYAADAAALDAAAKGASDGEVSETVAALADAKNTSYIRGKWVFHGSGISEIQYRIVAPSLPANGDYSAYLDWLSDNKDDVPKAAVNDLTPSRVAAFRIVGALTYTTQLTNLMSYCLNVRLPYKTPYGDFCKKLSEEQFLRKVSRLNSNIMYLAYTQQVKVCTLNENHTLENILRILDLEKSDLGRQGCHEVSNAPLIRSVDSLLLDFETASETESEEENSLRLDWEAVPSFPNQQDTDSSILNPSADQQSTITEGLIMSAANRLSSLLRWIK